MKASTLLIKAELLMDVALHNCEECILRIDAAYDNARELRKVLVRGQGQAGHPIVPEIDADEGLLGQAKEVDFGLPALDVWSN
jgi:hypothetical protein